MEPALALIVGVLIGVGLLLATRTREPSKSMNATGWAVLAVGLLGVISMGIGIARPSPNMWLLASMALAFAGSLLGIGRLIKRDRQWGVWLGSVLSAVPAVFWLVIVGGALLGA